MQEKFSGSWQIFRIMSHPQGGLDLATKFMTDKLSIRTLFDTLEMLDVYDALKKQAEDRQKNTKPK